MCWKNRIWGQSLPLLENKWSWKNGCYKCTKESCDVFFYEISKKLGIDKIEVAEDFKLGKIFDILMSNQKKG